jgi:hypothetical protein
MVGGCWIWTICTIREWYKGTGYNFNNGAFSRWETQRVNKILAKEEKD